MVERDILGCCQCLKMLNSLDIRKYSLVVENEWKWNGKCDLLMEKYSLVVGEYGLIAGKYDLVAGKCCLMLE